MMNLSQEQAALFAGAQALMYALNVVKNLGTCVPEPVGTYTGLTGLVDLHALLEKYHHFVNLKVSVSVFMLNSAVLTPDQRVELEEEYNYGLVARTRIADAMGRIKLVISQQAAKNGVN